MIIYVMKDILTYITEMDANKLPAKVEVEDDGQTISFIFGKNGWGLTTEFDEISKKIKELSKKNNVYLNNVIIDELDDVYTMSFAYDNKHFDD